MREPFHLRPWEIARLTPWQVKNVYFYPRDEEGRLLRQGEGGANSRPEDFEPLPALEDLRVPEEARAVTRRNTQGEEIRPPPAFVRLWWAVWRERQAGDAGLTDAYLLKRWTDEWKRGA